MRSAKAVYLVGAIAISAMYSLHDGVLFSRGLDLSDQAANRYEICLVVLLSLWILSDTRLPPKYRPTFDHGMFLWGAFPIVASHHLLKIYGWRCVLALLGIALLFFAPILTRLVIYNVA
jgi:hypothetical protein